jgi:hypothetical protein
MDGGRDPPAMLAAFYREYDAAAAAAAARPPRRGEAWPSPTAPHEDGSDSLGYKLDRTTGFDALHQKHLRDPTPVGPFDLTKELLLRVVRVGVLSGALGPREMLVLECTHSMFSRHLMEDLARQRIREREALRPGSSERVRARIGLRLPERSVAQHSADALRQSGLSQRLPLRARPRDRSPRGCACSYQPALTSRGAGCCQ